MSAVSSRALGRTVAATAAGLAGAALVLQYGLLVRATLDSIGPWLATLRFVSYFTILGNLMVLLVAGAAALDGRSALARFLQRADVRGGVATCIAVVMGVYVTVLQSLWSPQGTQWVADVALHYAVPVAYLAWWGLFVPHGALGPKHLPRWLLLPLIYLAWVFARAAWVDEVPYPFLEFARLGWPAVVRNASLVALVFALVGATVIAFDRWRGRNAAVAPA